MWRLIKRNIRTQCLRSIFVLFNRLKIIAFFLVCITINNSLPFWSSVFTDKAPWMPNTLSLSCCLTCAHSVNDLWMGNVRGSLGLFLLGPYEVMWPHFQWQSPSTFHSPEAHEHNLLTSHLCGHLDADSPINEGLAGRYGMQASAVRGLPHQDLISSPEDHSRWYYGGAKSIKGLL